MVISIQEATAGTYPIGIFTDGSGVRLGSLNIIRGQIQLAKAGGAFGTISGIATAYADKFGNYFLGLDTTDTNTRGHLRVDINNASALPVWQDFMVVPTLKYAFLYADGAIPTVNIVGSVGHVASMANPIVRGGSISFVSDGIIGTIARALSIGSLDAGIIGTISHAISVGTALHSQTIGTALFVRDGIVGTVSRILSVGSLDAGIVGTILHAQTIGTALHSQIVGTVGFIRDGVIGSVNRVQYVEGGIIGTVTRLVSGGSIGWLTDGLIGTVNRILSVGSIDAGAIGTVTFVRTVGTLSGVTLPSGVKKNVALSNFQFLMVLSSDHITGATGKTITAQISQNGGAFANCANAVSELSNGVYNINLTQAEMNADIITLKFTNADCDQRTITIITSA